MFVFLSKKKKSPSLVPHKLGCNLDYLIIIPWTLKSCGLKITEQEVVKIHNSFDTFDNPPTREGASLLLLHIFAPLAV